MFAFEPRCRFEDVENIDFHIQVYLKVYKNSVESLDYKHKETNENQKIIYNNKVIDIIKNDIYLWYASFPIYSRKQYNFGN